MAVFEFLVLLVAVVNGQFNTNPFGQYNSPNPFYGQNNQLPDPFFPGNNNNQFDPFGNPTFQNPQGIPSGGYYEPVYNPFNRPVEYGPRLEGSVRCPQHWVPFQQSCYRFIRSPVRNRHDARRNCQAFKSDLLSINNFDEHGFIIYQLLGIDPQHRYCLVRFVRSRKPHFFLGA